MSRKTALLVVDVQEGVVEWSGLGQQGEAVLANIRGLIDRARSTKAPVIYVQHDSGPHGRLAAGTPAWRIHHAIAPIEGEPVIGKLASDSFYQTALKSELERRGVGHLVVVGCRTQYCVDTTCRSATARGYDVTLAADAHTTMDTETLTASLIIAHHNETLDDFGNDRHVVRVRPSSEISF